MRYSMLREKLLIYSLTLFICAWPVAGVEARGEEQTSPTVNIASLAEKSMGGSQDIVWNSKLKR
jgi:hypothetical protein